MMSSNTPTKPSTASVKQQTNSNAALLGALVAIATRPVGRHPSSQRTPSPSNAYAASHGSTAGHGSLPLHARSPLPSSMLGPDTMKEKEKMLKMPHLGPPQQAQPPQSSSQQAAVIASRRAAGAPSERSRSGTTDAQRPPPIAPKPRRLSEHYSKSSIDGTSESYKPTDTTSIPPTTSLVDLFEQRAKASSQTQKRRPEPIVIKPSTDLTLKSPKPVRSGITSMFQLELEGKKQEAPGGTSAVVRQDTIAQDGHSSDDSFASASEDMDASSLHASIPRRTATTASPSPGQALKTENEAKRRPPPSPSPMRQAATKPIQIGPPARPSTAQSALSVSSAHSLSLKSIPAQFNQAYPRRMTPYMTGDELANAMVASSLASSRAPSPTKLEPPPVPTRKKKHNHHTLSFSRTPSPAKSGMLRTLRDQEESSSESEDEHHPYGKHKKKRLVRKHPNKHHEGDRKRWRDAVTDRERKRYEGVWAANKGLHFSFTPEETQMLRRAPQHQRTVEIKAAANEQVSNIVARDIWNRSRLPEAVLETVWDLVDTDSIGRLHKEEFVVGMWLIDQRLKGRKLPIKVSETVWASTRGIQGIKIKK